MTGPTLWSLAGFEVDLVSALVGVGATIVMTIVNVLGVRFAAIVQTFITLGIALAAVLLATGAITAGSITHMEPFFSPGVGGFLMVLVIVPVMLVGFDVIPQSAEEINLPPNRIGQVLVFSILFLLFLPPSPSALAWPAEWVIMLLWCAVGVAIYFTQRKAMHA